VPKYNNTPFSKLQVLFSKFSFFRIIFSRPGDSLTGYPVLLYNHGN